MLCHDGDGISRVLGQEVGRRQTRHPSTRDISLTPQESGGTYPTTTIRFDDMLGEFTLLGYKLR